MKYMMIAVVVGLMSAQIGFSQAAPEAKSTGTAGLDNLFKKDKPVVLKRGVQRLTGSVSCTRASGPRSSIRRSHAATVAAPTASHHVR
jgi:hypothetical protein